MSQQSPPPYEAITNGGDSSAQLNLLNSGDQTPLLNTRAPKSRKFSSQKFILQWLGIGYGYSFICLLFCVFLFGGGIAVVVLTVADPGHGLSCQCLEHAKILTMIAGGVLVLLATFWPCVWFWHQSGRHRSFIPFICYAWLLSLIYFGILCALSVEVYEQHKLMWNPRNYIDNVYHGYANSSCTHEELKYCRNSFSSIPLWTVAPMGGMMAVFFIVSCLVCGCFNAAGSIW